MTITSPTPTKHHRCCKPPTPLTLAVAWTPPTCHVTTLSLNQIHRRLCKHLSLWSITRTFNGPIQPRPFCDYKTLQLSPRQVSKTILLILFTNCSHFSEIKHFLACRNPDPSHCGIWSFTFSHWMLKPTVIFSILHCTRYPIHNTCLWKFQSRSLG